MISERLRYRQVTLADLDEFVSLVQDPYVRRYLLDGHLYSREWCEERIGESEALFERRGVGIWLVSGLATHELIGFCGFLEILQVHPAPELVYALFERFAGQGFATEMARTSIAHALQSGLADIFASVDEINAASLHILDKLGFERVSNQQGSFGKMHLLRLSPASDR